MRRQAGVLYYLEQGVNPTVGCGRMLAQLVQNRAALSEPGKLGALVRDVPVRQLTMIAL